MKKIILIALFVLCVSAVEAQVVSSKSRTIRTETSEREKASWGLRVGLNVADMHTSWKGGGENGGTTCGFNVGVICDIPVVSRYFYIQPGLYFTQKGYSYKEDWGDGEYEKASMHPYYAEIPILFSGRYDITKDITVQLDLGPYFACGLFGKYKEEECAYYNRGYQTYKDDSDCFDDMNRFDCGIDFGVGFTFFHDIYIGFEYEWGLVNVAKYTDGDYSVKNRNCMINIGYTF